MRVSPPLLSRMAATSSRLLQRGRGPSTVREHPAPVAGHGARSAHLPRQISTSSDSDLRDSVADIRDRILLLTEKPEFQTRPAIPEDLRCRIAVLAQELLALADPEGLHAVLDSSSASSVLRETPDGWACVELLRLLSIQPLRALAFVDWRRKKLGEAGTRMLSEEFVKGISLAGRVKNVDLAVELFNAAGKEGLRATSTYNALMAAYLYTESPKKCLALFEDLKRDAECKPTIVTYNMLLSVFGRSMLVDHMETILRAVKDSDLKPTLKTYNTVIAGYVTAWMWDKMESTFQTLKDYGLEPDTCTHLLMLRGYAHGGNLEKMEKTYEIVREWVDNYELPLIRAMICAYCKSSDPERVRKIEELSKCVPENDYRPWLNVLLIRLYAQEGLMEKMEALIYEAFCRGTVVTTVNVMHSIISSYFNHDAQEHLTRFIRQAESAGWKLSRSLYHCEMAMYGKQNRFNEMKNVINEMEDSKFDPTKKTFLIMYKMFLSFGKKVEAESVIGLMWKRGFLIPEDPLYPS